MTEPPFKIGNVTVNGRALIAPMTGISDLPFRQMAAKFGAPYAATEMVACAELERARPDVVRKVQLGDHEGLKIVQLIGRDPAMIAKAARLADLAGADIIDLNFGCPAKEVTGILCGSALMRDMEAATEIMQAARNATQKPVTVKMRLGWDEDNQNAPQLAQIAQRVGIEALTVHGRTRQQFYKGVANWAAIAEVKRATDIPVIVNGDIVDHKSAQQALLQSKAAALMIGRAALGQPWLAHNLDDKTCNKRPENICAHVIEHMTLSLRFYGDALGLKMFKKHLAAYLDKAFDLDAEAARQARGQICRLETPNEIENALLRLEKRNFS
jgi:nifR3 family TIM-barrel protein